MAGPGASSTYSLPARPRTCSNTPVLYLSRYIIQHKDWLLPDCCGGSRVITGAWEPGLLYMLERRWSDTARWTRGQGRWRSSALMDKTAATVSRKRWPPRIYSRELIDVDLLISPTARSGFLVEELA